MKRLRTIKLLLGATLLTLIGAVVQSCRPVINTCYKPALPDDRDTSGYKTIRNSCYDIPAEPIDTTPQQ
ncbi:MAG: hypothetical protein RB294_08830 [Bacteroidales bacterium]|jgi:hypothetical protein|nr:hypothetical protein [Bacteroidales bacterium]